jgi:hypothetical protein
LPIVEFSITRNFACPQPLALIVLLSASVCAEKTKVKPKQKLILPLAYFCRETLLAETEFVKIRFQAC